MSNMLRKHWQPITIGVLVVFVISAVGVVIVNAMTDYYTDYPLGAFKVVNKEVKENSVGVFFWWTYKVYCLYYKDEPGHWVETSQADYDKYQIGDIYPHTYDIVH